MRKAELAVALTNWGLVVEGDETLAELTDAYRSMKEYRLSGDYTRVQRSELHTLRQSTVGSVDRHEAAEQRATPGWN
jgi:hypothetical protein